MRGEGDAAKRRRVRGPTVTYRNAARYRSAPTEAERRLWSVLRDRRLSGYRFRRQHPVGPYVADFACVTHRVVVELDGSQHAEERAAHDAKRDDFIREQGYRVLRFWNPDLMRNRVGVLETILDALAARPSPASLRSSPSPHMGRG
jgi:very-short-patch-repair endonuclease